MEPTRAVDTHPPQPDRVADEPAGSSTDVNRPSQFGICPALLNATIADDVLTDDEFRCKLLREHEDVHQRADANDGNLEDEAFNTKGGFVVDTILDACFPGSIQNPDLSLERTTQTGRRRFVDQPVKTARNDHDQNKDPDDRDDDSAICPTNRFRHRQSWKRPVLLGTLLPLNRLPLGRII